MPNQRVTASLRQAVRERAEGRCEYCKSQARFATETFAVEHIVPRFADGGTVLENLALSCFGCNSHKHVKMSAVDPQTHEEVPLFHPRLQVWIEHFSWTADFTYMVGLTAVGRATIIALHLNRNELVNLRQVLHRVGEHPP